MRKLKIGDKITGINLVLHKKWNQRIGGNLIYTVLDIDTSHEQTVITTPNKIYYFDSQILLQWQEWDGRITQCWNYSLDDFNRQIADFNS